MWQKQQFLHLRTCDFEAMIIEVGKQKTNNLQLILLVYIRQIIISKFDYFTWFLIFDS